MYFKPIKLCVFILIFSFISSYLSNADNIESVNYGLIEYNIRDSDETSQNLTFRDKLSEVDRNLFNYVHKDMNNKFLDKATPIIQLMGDPRAYISICALLCAFGDEDMFETGKLSTAGFVESGAVIFSLKSAIGRPRPLNNEDKTSFPSGHSTFAFTLATIVGNRYPKLRIPLYLTAMGTAFSRVYLGRHYPSDVLAGAIFGTLIGINILHYDESILRFSF